MKKDRGLPSFFRCTAGVIVSMAVLSSLIINPLAEGTGSGSGVASASGVSSSTVSTEQLAATSSQISSASQSVSSGASSEVSSSATASSSASSSSSGSSSLASSGASNTTKVLPRSLGATLNDVQTPLADGTPQISSEETANASEIVSSLGIANNFSVFAQNFTLAGHMSGNVAVNNFWATSGNTGLDSDGFNNITKMGKFSLIASLSVGSLNAQRTKTYYVGVYEDEKASLQISGSPFTVNVDNNGDGTAMIPNLDTSHSYYAYLCNSDGKKIINKPSQVIALNNNVYASNDDSYIQHFTPPNSFTIPTKGNEWIGLTLFQTSGFPQSVTFGSTYRLINKDDHNSPITLYTTSPQSNYRLVGGSNYNDVIVDVGNDTTANSANIATDPNNFPIDYDGTLKKLSNLSSTLSLAGDCNASTMKVVDISLSGSETLKGKLLSYFNYSTDPNSDDLAPTTKGIPLSQGQYLVVNVNCGSNNTVTIPKCSIGGVSYDTAWTDMASRIIWNFYSKDNTGKYIDYAGTVNSEASLIGTILAPGATVNPGGTMCGAVYANTASNPKGEIHKMTFGFTAKCSFTMLYSLKVIKQWIETGNPVSNQTHDPITVQLYNGKSKYGNSVQLDASNNWSYPFDPLPSSGTYTVVEETSLSNYTSNIGPPMYDETTNTYTITITNSYQPQGYTLPAAGGPGTVIFTVIGGATTLLAIALLLLYRRRRAERRTG